MDSAGVGAHTEKGRRHIKSEEQIKSVCRSNGAFPVSQVHTGSSPLAQLYQSHYRELLRFCLMRVRNEADAEDIIQSAFVAARQSYPDKGFEELKRLLFTLVRNGVTNHLKAHWNSRRYGEDLIALGEQLVCPKSPTPEKQTMDAERLAIAEAVISGMSERRQMALRLKRYEGCTYEEIARRLSISPAAVKKHVARAVAEIAVRLAEADGPEEYPAG